MVCLRHFIILHITYQGWSQVFCLKRLPSWLISCVWSRHTWDGELNVSPMKCQWEVQLHICLVPSQHSRPKYTGPGSQRPWQRWAEGEPRWNKDAVCIKEELKKKVKHDFHSHFEATYFALQSIFCVYDYDTHGHVLLKELFTFPRIESYIPGMAFLLGFSQQHERNAKQEVSASVVAASADSVNVKIKFPEVLKETFTSYIFMQNF